VEALSQTIACQKLSRHECTYNLRAEFGEHAIPDPVRAKIKDVRHVLDHVYIVAEAAPDGDYQSHIVRLPAEDPLVIGQKGDDFWLIDAFDLTPREAYLCEFTYKL